MTSSAANPVIPPDGRPGLSAHLLGRVEFEDLLAVQRRLVYEVGGQREGGVVILCEHPPGITVGREGSRAHIRPSCEELHGRGWPVRWLSRGGGVMLHLPGQVACYPIVALDRLGWSPGRYVEELMGVVVDVLQECGIAGEPCPDAPGVRVGARRIAHVGAAVRDNVTSFGFVLNVDVELGPFHDVHCDGDPVPMTSVQRAAPTRARIPAVRQQILSALTARFGFDRLSVFHNLPGHWARPPFPPGPGGGKTHAATTRPR